MLLGLVLAVLIVLRGTGDEPRRPAQAAPSPTPTPGPLAGVERRIGRAGLSEHLEALQRIAGEHGGNRSSGSAGERATAEYVAGTAARGGLSRHGRGGLRARAFASARGHA